MPATFPSHAAAVLPLKLWRPHWFDGVALVVGSTAPDLTYPLAGIVTLPETHTTEGLLWLCLPVTLLVTWLVRWAAPVVAAHLPRVLALGDYGVLGLVHHRWYVVVSSALLGAGSHIVWDGFTHHPTGHGWVARGIAAMQRDGLLGQPWWTVTQWASTVVGAVVALGFAVHIGRRRLLLRWHGPAPASLRMPALFWSTAGGVAALYPVTWPLLPYRYSAHVQGVRILWAVGLGLLAGAVAVRAPKSWRSGAG